MASVEDELHSEEARLEQGGPEGLEPELLRQHLARQSRVGWRSEEDPTGDSHGAFLSQSQGNSPESHSSHCWGAPLPACMTQVSNKVRCSFQGAKTGMGEVSHGEMKDGNRGDKRG